MCVYIYICLYICTYMYVYIHTYIYILYIYTYLYNVYIYIHIYITYSFPKTIIGQMARRQPHSPNVYHKPKGQLKGYLKPHN